MNIDNIDKIYKLRYYPYFGYIKGNQVFHDFFKTVYPLAKGFLKYQKKHLKKPQR